MKELKNKSLKLRNKIKFLMIKNILIINLQYIFIVFSRFKRINHKE